MSIQQTNGSPVTSTSTKNNNGVILANGTSNGPVSAKRVVDNPVGVFGSVVIDGSTSDKALSAGTFAYNNIRPVAMKLTSKLSGVSNDFLVSASNDVENLKSINYQQVDAGVDGLVDGVRTVQKTSAIREGKWDIYSGKYDAGFPVVVEDEFSGADGVSGDKAAKLTRLNTGVLVYKLNSKTPVSQDYPKKTG